MNERGFCNWIAGVLAMAEDEEGEIHLTKTQYEKIKQRLETIDQENPQEMMKPSPHRPPSGGLNYPPGARC
ncbi:MAG: hypothetical protein AB7L09_02920 [Nitrospira sp.]